MNEAEGRKVADEINAQQAGTALFLVQDVRDEKRWQEVIAETVQTFGGLHVLVNNAGIVKIATPERLHARRIPLPERRDVRRRVPRLQARDPGDQGQRRRLDRQHVVGRIAPRLPGLLRLQRRQGRRALDDQVDRRALPDEQVQHPLQLDSRRRDRHADGARVDRPLGMDMSFWESSPTGLGKPEDVANLVVYLASDESRFVNGTEILIDNALTVQ